MAEDSEEITTSQTPSAEPLYRKIPEVADMLGETSATLRWWEREIGQPKPRTDKRGTRYYTAKDIETLRLIQFLVREKHIELKGVRAELLTQRGDKYRRTVAAITHLREVRKQLMEWMRILARTYDLPDDSSENEALPDDADVQSSD